MKTPTVGHWDLPATTPPTSVLQSHRGTMNKVLRGAVLCVALGLGAASLPAVAELRVVVRDAPPPLQIETVPAARPGYLWAPGFWRWQNRRHVWAVGHWERERRGQRYESARWEQRGDRYHFAPARWQRERESRRGG
jgi:WXXGXW repeat (2 copies)